MLAKFSVLTRLHEHENSNLVTKMRVYDGENLKDTGPKAKSMPEYRDAAGVDEGMTGTSTRFAFTTLSETFHFDADAGAADPVTLLDRKRAVRRKRVANRVDHGDRRSFNKTIERTRK